MKTTIFLVAAFMLAMLIPSSNILTGDVERYADKEQNPTEFDCMHKVHSQDDVTRLEEAIRRNEVQLQKDADGYYIIPVVVHVIHKGEEIGTGTNISDEQIYSGINGMNEDFSKELLTNGDGMGGASPFRFMLINKDDEGNPTTGIYRFNGCISSIYCNEGITAGNGQGAAESIVKNWSIQDNQWAYNIWIVSEIENNNGGGGIQGYAYFPTTSYVDGIVQLYNAFGTVGNLKSYTDLNRTLTHEMGHAFALFHTFQGNSCTETNCALQGDRVCDTPPTTLGSDCNPNCGGTQQVENYMDYTSEHCKDMFSVGQIDRMTLAAVNSRPNLLESGAMDNLTDIEADVTLNIVSPQETSCGYNDYLTVEVTNTTTEVVHKIDFEYTIGDTTETYCWFGPIGPGGVDIITLAPIGVADSVEISVAALEVNDNPATAIDTMMLNVPDVDPYTVEVQIDALGSQLSWNIKDADTDEILYESEQYFNFEQGTQSSDDICLPDGCYVFTAVDTQPPFLDEEAYIRLVDSEGNVLAELDDSGLVEYEFCLDNVPDFDCPELNANIGDACDDGNPETENDIVTENCGCEGTIIYDCPELEANIGDPCDDGNPNTENDTVIFDCDCQGTPIPQFELTEITGEKCYRLGPEGPIVVFYTVNDMNVNYYNFYKSYSEDVLPDGFEWEYAGSIFSQQQPGPNEYIWQETNYNDEQHVYLISAVMNDGTEVYLEKFKMICKEPPMKLDCKDFEITNGKFIVPSNDVKYFNGNGVEVKDPQPGKLYIVYWGWQNGKPTCGVKWVYGNPTTL